MDTATSKARSPSGGLAFSNPRDLFWSGLKLFALMIVDAFGLIIIYSFLYDDNLPLAIVFIIITVGVNVIIFVPGLYPLRWMSPGLALLVLLVIYPIYYTVSTAFTNYGDGHLFTKDQAIGLIEERGFVPETATTYSWVPFRTGEDYALWLVGADGTIFWALPGEPVREIDPAEDLGIVARPEEGPPELTGFTVLEDSAALAEVEALEYGSPVGTVRLAMLDLETRYLFDIEEGVALDQEDGVVYDVSVLQNDDGEYALWLVESEATEVDEALLAYPGEEIIEVDLEDTDELDELNITLATGLVGVAESVGSYNRQGFAESRDEAIAELTFGEDGDDVVRASAFDLETRFVFDPAQNLTLDRETGDTFDTVAYTNEDGEYGLWLDGGATKYLLRPGWPVLVDESSRVRPEGLIPATFDGYDQMIALPDRVSTYGFFELADFELFGEEGDTIGVQDTATAGRPYLRRFIYNEVEDAFIDLSTISRLPAGLNEANVFEESDLALNGIFFDGDNEEGIFVPVRLRFVYNEPAGAFIDLASINRSGVTQTPAEMVSADLSDSGALAGATLYRDFADQGVFAPASFVYNSTSDAFIDTATIPETVDIEGVDLATVDLDTVEGLDQADIFTYNEDAELYVPAGYIYNETMNVFIDLTSIDASGLDLSGIDLGRISTDAGAAVLEAEPYSLFAEQGVITPPEFVYNSTSDVFINTDEVDDDVAEAVDLTTVDVATLEDLDPEAIYYRDEETDLWVPRTFVYSERYDEFLDLSRVDTDEVDLSQFDLPNVDIEDEAALERVRLVSRDNASDPFIYDVDTPVLNEDVGAYLYLPDTDLTGIDLATVNMAALEALGEVSTTPANSSVVPRLIYDDSLARSDTNPDHYVFSDQTQIDNLSPGYRVNVGFTNFTQLFEDRSLLEPLIDIFIWTIMFAFLSVFTTFWVGLFMALILNDPAIPGRKIWRSLLFVPYAIPGVISILVWRGMLNQNLGIITTSIDDLFGYSIPWFADPFWAKVAVIMVNLWLGYPYMMLICSGALQAIPSDIYEAASVDGANPRTRFWGITLPLLLITVGPLLIASFTFNFNNYLMIEALTQGDPPIAGTSTPAGHTDLLINYTYNLAFGSNRGADYGYASAITIVIFALVAGITMLQYRLTRRWEEVGENV